MMNSSPDLNKIVPFGRNSQFYFTRAMQEYEKGNLQRVCNLLQLAITYNPEDIWNYYSLAQTFEDMGEWQQAVDIWLNQVLVMDDEFAEAYYHLAVCYAELGQMERVYAYMEEYLSLEPDGDMEEGARQVLRLLNEEHDTQDAAEFSETLRIMNDLEKQLAVLLNSQAYSEALDVCEDVIEEEGDLPPLLNRASLIAFLAGEDQLGLDWLETVLAEDPANVGAHCNLVFYHYLTGDEVRTQKIIESRSAMPFDSAAELLQWTQTLGNIGRHRRVYDLLNAMLRDGEYSIHLYFQQGVAALKLGLLKEANAAWRNAALLDNLRTPAELYHQLLLQADDPAELAEHCTYSLDWPLLESFRVEADSVPEDLSEGMQKLIFICLRYYLRHGTEDIVSRVFDELPLLNESQREQLIQEFMLSEYDDMKIHILEKYDPRLTFVKALKSQERIYLIDSSFEEQVSAPFLVTFRMIKDHLVTYDSDVLVRFGQKIWYSYCNKSHPNPRRINRSTVWAAAVECIVLEIFNFDCDYDSIANRHRVKRTSMMRAMDEILLIVCTPE